MKHIKTFKQINEAADHLSDDIFDWIKSEFGSDDVEIKKISSSEDIFLISTSSE